MEYREWGYERDPRDRVAAPSLWSDAGDPTDEERYDESRPRYERSTSWDGNDRWSGSRLTPDGAAGRYDSDRHSTEERESGYTTGAWTYGHQTGSWETAEEGWPAVPPQPDESATDLYPAPARWGQVLDHEDWYEQPPTPIPTPRRHADIATRPRTDEPRDARVDEDDEEADRRFIPVLLLTALWYAVPLVLYLIWSATLSGTPAADCADAAGDPCLSPRSHAFGALFDGLPRVAIAFGLSVIVGFAIRLIGTGWRAISIGFAAAVVGAGIATAVFSFLSTGSTA